MTGISKCGHIWKLNDRTEKMEAFRNHIERSISINRDTDCWKWTGNICPRLRWGIFNCRGARIRAQIAAYEVYCGPMVHGTHILTSCQERTCCNPDHLFMGHTGFRTEYSKSSKNGSWDLDASGVTSVKEMLRNGKDAAHIAISLNIPIGVVNRIQLRGKQNNSKETNGS